MTTYFLKESKGDTINTRFCKKGTTTYFLSESDGDWINTRVCKKER